MFSEGTVTTEGRSDGRRADELRSVKATRGYLAEAEGSVLFEMGGTRLVVSATVEQKVPQWLKGERRGWVTAEYAMLPRSTTVRTPRDGVVGRVSGRSQEIQRLIGRSLRSVVDLKALGERTIWVDCDVIQADGGTRTAAITAGFLALADALALLKERGEFERLPLHGLVAATSVGVVGDAALLDLRYEEDVAAEVDMNVVMTSSGDFVEVQGTAEQEPFSRDRLVELLDLAEKGVTELIAMQRGVLGEVLSGTPNPPAGSS